MRVALVHYTAPPVVGGVERIIGEQAAALSRRGHDVTIVCGNVNAHVDGVTVVQASELAGSTGAPLSTVLQGMEAVFVHNLFTMPFNLLATQQLRLLDVEMNKTHWVNWVHDVAILNPAYMHLPWQEPDYQMFRQPAANCTNVAVSETRRREYLNLLRLPDSSCKVIPNGVDVAKVLHLTPRVTAMVDPLRLWDRDYVIVHPTRLVRRKNIELTLRITAGLQDHGLDVACLITGAADPHNADSVTYKKELDAYAHALELDDSVFFLGEDGPLTDEDVRCLYTVSDALIFPSKAEGFGLPIVEAALHGMPVFCSDIPAHRELSRCVAGFFALDDHNSSIVNLITQHPGVTERYERRLTVAGVLDWSRVCTHYLEPLLQSI